MASQGLAEVKRLMVVRACLRVPLKSLKVCHTVENRRILFQTCTKKHSFFSVGTMVFRSPQLVPDGIEVLLRIRKAA